MADGADSWWRPRPERLDGRFVRDPRRSAIQRGQSPGPGRCWIDLREANRDRELGRAGARPSNGRRTYLLLLNPADGTVPDPRPQRLRAGRAACEGREPCPKRGRRDARGRGPPDRSSRSRHDDFLPWTDLGRMLEDPTPCWSTTALELFVKFRQGSADLLPGARTAPRPPARRRPPCRRGPRPAPSSRRTRDDVAERAGVVAELTAARPAGRRRRSVRGAATGALSSASRTPRIDETLLGRSLARTRTRTSASRRSGCSSSARARQGSD